MSDIYIYRFVLL